MLQLSDSHWLPRPMSRRVLSSAIRGLDLAQDKSLTVGPFGVFPVSSNLIFPARMSSGNATPFLSELDLSTEIAEGADTNDPIHSPTIIRAWPETNFDKTASNFVANTPKITSAPLRMPFSNTFPMNSAEERRLMHYWIQFLSPLMIPLESRDNPFHTVISPLALTAAYNPSFSAAHSALLHAVYALADASRANLQQVEQSRRVIGARHRQFSLQYLARSISSNDQAYPEVVLAAISTLVMASIINGDSTDWRIHLRGAFFWIKSVDKSVWKRSRNASAIYQIFLCVEALRPAHISLALELEPGELFLEDLSKGSEEDQSWEDSDYCLDNVFCIPRSILEAIIRINKWVYMGSKPPAAELDSLKLLIVRSNPEAMRVNLSATATEKLIWHHNYLWHASAYLYLKRSLQKVPLSGVQYLVRQSVEQLDAITLLEQGQNVSGTMWSAFISGCEADETHSRDGMERYFDKRETLGIGNAKDARAVVREVWKRRDEGTGATDILWHEVMVDLGINISIS